MRRTEKQQAIKLRLRGKSYNEIRTLLEIPSKGTLSYWFRDLSLSPNAKRRLAHNIFLAQKRGLLKFNRERTKYILLENKKALNDGRNEIGGLSKRELLLVGASLYWGEGAKNPYSKNISLALANSDPLLVALYMRFVREIIQVPEGRIRAGIQVHPNMDIEKAKRFWAKITMLPKNRFYIVKQISRASRFKRPKNTLRYGTVSIRINKRVLFYKVKGYIKGLSDNAGNTQ